MDIPAFVTEVRKIADQRNKHATVDADVYAMYCKKADPFRFTIYQLHGEEELQLEHILPLLYINKYGLTGCRITPNDTRTRFDTKLPPLTPEIKAELWPEWNNHSKAGTFPPTPAILTNPNNKLS